MYKALGNRLTKYIFGLCVLVTAALIFAFSSFAATESSEQSGSIVEYIVEAVGIEPTDEVYDTVYHNLSFIVRKAAHMLEYAALGFFVMGYFCHNPKIKSGIRYVFSVLFSSLYAASDEIHQLFVEGRACRISDLGFDTFGAAVGALVFFGVFCIVIKIKSRKRN